MTRDHAIPCRQCGSTDLKDRGRIPPATVFAGQPLSPPWDGGTLYECRRCLLGFRHPVRDEAEYERLYGLANEAVWTTADLRHDQMLVKQAIESQPGARTVLDVGCYDGRLLASLGAAKQRFGVEVSAAAADVARSRGIDIIAASIRELRSVALTFDAVCAVDVIEHVADPRALLADLARLLSPDGTVILSTGSLDAPAWRYAGGRYWYCGYPEHISFISPGWARAVAPALGLEVVGLQRFEYRVDGLPASTSERLRFVRKVAKSGAKLLAASMLPAGTLPRTPHISYGRPGLFEDHFLVIFRRARH